MAIFERDVTQDSSPSAGRTAALTYEPYYGLREKPFSLSADPRFLYKSRSHASAFDELIAAIQRREGLIVLTGDIGTGKTTLCRAVLDHLDQKTFSAFVPDPFVSREDLLKMLLIDFGVMSIQDLKSGRLKGASRPDLSYPLYEFLNALVPLQAFAVLLIDEAQNLSLPLLEEVRILSELEGREKLLQVVLIGQPELRSQLKLPQMRQVDQRVSVRCELAPLGREGVTAYVTHRLTVAGGGKSSMPFSTEALDAIYVASGGVPRVINLICDRALQYGHINRTSTIEPGIISRAINDLDLSVSPPPEQLAPLTNTVTAVRIDPVASPAPTDVDLGAPLESSPVTWQHTARPLVQAHEAEPPPLPCDLLEQFPSELQVPGRTGNHFAINKWERTEEVRRAYAWPLAATLLLVPLVGAIVGGAWYLYDTRGSLAEASSVPNLPRSPVLLNPSSLEASIRLDAGAVTPDRLAPHASAPEGSSVPVNGGTNSYVIQVASFQSDGRAGRLVELLTSAGYRAHVVELDSDPLRGRLVPVLVGPYKTLSEAEADLDRIREIPGYADARVRDVSPAGPSVIN